MSDQLRIFNEELERSASQLNSLNTVLGSNINNTKILNQVTKEQIDVSKKENDELEKFTNNANKTVKGLIGFGKSLTSNAGSFEPLGQVVLKAGDAIGGVLSYLGPIGKMFGGITKAGAEVSNFMIQSFEKAYTTFERVSQTGIVDSFSTFEQSAASMGLTFNDFDKVLAKNSKEIAVLGGSALTGRKMLETLGAGSEQLRMQFQKLGISTADANEFQLSYLIQQQRMSKGRIQMTDQLIAESGNYVKELDLTAKLTGLTRKEVDSARQARLKDPGFLAGFMEDQNISKKAREEINFLLDSFHKIDPSLEKMLMALVRSGRAVPEAVPLVRIAEAGGINIVDLVERMKRGEGDLGENIREIVGGLKQGSDSMKVQTQVMGDKDIFGLFSVTQDLYNQLGQFKTEELESIKKQIENQTKDESSDNAALAKAKQNLYKSSQMLEKLSVSSDLVAGMMDKLSWAMHTMLKTAYEAAGMELPKHVEAQEKYLEVSTERQDSERRIQTLQQEVNELLKVSENENQKDRELRNNRAALKMKDITDLEKKLPSLKREEEKLQKKMIDEQVKSGIVKYFDDELSNESGSPMSGGGGGGGGSSGSTSSAVGASGGTGMGSSGGVVSGGGGGDSGATSGVTVTSSSGSDSGKTTTDYSGLNIKTAKMVNGVPEPVAGGPATSKVVDLARKIQEKYPGVTFTAFNDTYSRKSPKHSLGQAVDFVFPGGQRPGVKEGQEIVAQLKSLGASFALDEYNRPSSGATAPHMHAQVSARTGGILSGPKSGYLAELHGDEAVVSNNVSKQPLNSEVSNMTNPSDKTKLSTIYEEVSYKMETLVKLISDQSSQQKKMMESKLD